MNEGEIAARLAVAGLAGLAIGIEREWSGHATGPGARFAGVRTFFLLGVLGAVAGTLAEQVGPIPGAALLAGGAAFVIVAYFAASRAGGEAIDGTTEAAALLVLGLGMLAGLGALAVVSGASAVAVLALSEKNAVRRFVERIDAAEMRGALQFAVLALVILPLLPEGPIGPWGGIRPRGLWIVVLIFSGLNFLGFLARRALGPSRGYAVMGALGGAVSSTLVTLNFSRRSREEPDHAASLALGTVAACTVLVPRILLLTLLLSPGLLPVAALALAPVFLAGVGITLFGMTRPRPGPANEQAPEDQNPLKLWTAVRMTLAFQAVLVLLDLVTGRFGVTGVYTGAALLGLTDMDALTFGMSRLAADAALVATAATALAIGVLSNSLLKAAVALILGGPGFRRRAVPALLLFGAAAVAGIWLVQVFRRG